MIKLNDMSAECEKNYKKIFAFWALVFLVGGMAGIIFGQLIVPWLTNFRPFSAIGWLGYIKNGTTIINRTEKIYLTQDLAYQEAIDRVVNSVVAVRAELNKKVLAETSGFILTSDGLIVTANSVVPKATGQILVVRDNKESEAQLLGQDKENGLALLKLSETNLPVVNFGDSANLKLGEMVFLVGAGTANETFSKFANVGFIKTLEPLTLTISESPSASGSPLINIKGEVLGLNLVDKEGKIKVVLIERVRELLK